MSRSIRLGFSLLCLCLSSLTLESAAGQISLSQAKRAIKQLRGLDDELPEVRPGDWLANHEEAGQTFAQYVRIRPNALTRQRKTLYVQPLGKLTETEAEIVTATSEYLAAFFQCPVESLAAITDPVLPESARRDRGDGTEQWLAPYVLEKTLAPDLPRDAFATIGLTNQDLWPGEGWNFVFGYASYRDRVGVWSLNRFGDPAKSERDYRACLQRTIHLAAHETGHMFSILHCTHARCCMQGSNSLVESDSQPMHLCSQCVAKICWATGSEPSERYQKLLELCRKHGFKEEAEFYSTAIERLKK